MADTPPAPAPCRWRRRIAGLTLQAARAYAVVVCVLLLLENWLLYQPGSTSDWAEPRPGLNVEDVSLAAADGTAVHGWLITPDGWRPAEGAFLFCHGNGGNLSWRQGAFTPWHREHRQAVLIFDYPGYGKSGGSTSEAGCYAAADAAYDWLTRQRNVPPGKLVVWGGSLGAAVALDLAVRKPCRALLLMAPFTSFPDIAQTKFPWLPGRWLVRNQFDNLAKVHRLRVPLFITHDRRDGTIPFSQGELLFDAAPAPKRFYPTDRGLHNDMPAAEAAWPALQAFLDACEKSGP
jgi:fermentation-respiration switch protein FrsA (DUF1100 family)